MNQTEQPFSVGSRVRIASGNAQGKTGTVRDIEGKYCVVKSDETGNDRRFGVDRLELVALLPNDDDCLKPNLGSTATSLENLPPESGSTATQIDDEPLPDAGVALLPQLENLRDRLRQNHPLSKGWLNDEPRRLRYCYRVSGKLVCTTVKPKELQGYRDRLRYGRVLVAVEQVISYVQRDL